jgi:hypothetical protein
MSWLHHLQCALRHKEQRRGEAAEEATQPATAYHASWDTAPCATQQRSSVGKRRAHRSRPRRHRGALRRDRQAWFPHGSPSIPWARTRRPRTSAARPAEPFSALCVTQGEPQRRAPHRNRTSPGADVAAGEPSPGADVAAGESSPGADVAAVSPSPGADVAVDAAPTSSCMRVFSNQNGLVMTAVAVPAISAERGAAAASDITCARPRMFADVCACGCLCLRARAGCKLPCCFRGAVLVSPGGGVGRAGGWGEGREGGDAVRHSGSRDVCKRCVGAEGRLYMPLANVVPASKPHERQQSGGGHVHAHTRHWASGQMWPGWAQAWLCGGHRRLCTRSQSTAWFGGLHEEVSTPCDGRAEDTSAQARVKGGRALALADYRRAMASRRCAKIRVERPHTRQASARASAQYSRACAPVSRSRLRVWKVPR